MGVVSVTTFATDTETVTKTKLNGLAANLVTEFNGSIDNTNIKAAAAIAFTKLALTDNITFTGNIAVDGGTFTFNASAADLDFIVGSDKSANSLVVDGATGAVTKADNPCFLVHPASTQENIAVGSAVTIVFGTERFDVGGNFATNVFTAPITGKYLLSYNIGFSSIDSAATSYQLSLITSNKTYEQLRYFDKLSGDQTRDYFNATIIVDMDATDTAYLGIYQTGGTQQTDITTSSFFSGALLQ